MMPFTERAAGLQKVRKLLRKEYGKQTIPISDCIARQILWFVLLERSSFQQADHALHQIDELFVDLNELRVSLPREIGASIPGTPDADVKAYRATRVFNSLFLLKNTMDWSFVRSMGVRELRQFFEKIDGGDAVLAAAMAMFFTSGHAIPADADVRRTLQRLGLAEENEDVGQLQSFLERGVNKEEGSETWALLHRLAEAVCQPGEPLCDKCPVAAHCPFGQQKLAAMRQKKRASRSGVSKGTASAGKSVPRSAKAKPAKSTAAEKSAASVKVKPAAKRNAAKAKSAAKTAGSAKAGTKSGKSVAAKASNPAKASAKSAGKASKGGTSSKSGKSGGAKVASRAAPAARGRTGASRSRGR